MIFLLIIGLLTLIADSSDNVYTGLEDDTNEIDITIAISEPKDDDTVGRQFTLTGTIQLMNDAIFSPEHLDQFRIHGSTHVPRDNPSESSISNKILGTWEKDITVVELPGNESSADHATWEVVLTAEELGLLEIELKEDIELDLIFDGYYDGLRFQDPTGSSSRGSALYLTYDPTIE